jgi:predicted  nucleic acid-binding Zn-ribbon protein
MTDAPGRSEVVARKVGCPHCGRHLFVETEAALLNRIAALEQERDEAVDYAESASDDLAFLRTTLSTLSTLLDEGESWDTEGE